MKMKSDKKFVAVLILFVFFIMVSVAANLTPDHFIEAIEQVRDTQQRISDVKIKRGQSPPEQSVVGSCLFDTQIFHRKRAFSSHFRV